MEGGRVARHASKEKIGVDDDALKGRPKLMDTFSPRERSLPEGGLHFFFSSFIRGMDRPRSWGFSCHRV